MVLAAAGKLVTFGIVPIAPETGYGYIEQGKNVGGDFAGATQVTCFAEKPNEVLAKKYVESGNLLW